MIIINLTRKIKAKEMIKEFEDNYGSIERLERTFKRGDGNMKMQMDLEDWKYFLKNPDEEITDGKTVLTDDINIGKIELEIINQIKNNAPKSINELSKNLNKDNSTIQRKIKQLEKNGLVKLEKGKRNIKIPVVNYDKIEIEV